MDDNIKDTGLLEQYLENLDSKTLKDIWINKKLQEKWNKKQGSMMIKYRYHSEADFIKDLEEKLRNSASIKETAQKMNVTTMTVKRHAMKYFPDLYKACRGLYRRGVHREYYWDKGKFPLKDIIEGKYPDYPIWKFRDKLIKFKMIPYECSVCGFSEARITKTANGLERKPIMLDFIDGDISNHKLDNVRFLCYNHFYLLVGNLTGMYKNKIVSLARARNSKLKKETE